MDWLTAMLIAVSTSIFVALTDKYVVSHVKTKAYMFLIGVIGLLSFVFLPGSPTQLDLNQWILGITIGLIFCFSVYANFKAYEVEEVSRLAPLGILSTILITLGAAIFFGERLTTQQYYAFGLFVIGSLLLSTRLHTSIEFLDFSKLSVTNRKVKMSAFRNTLHELAANPSVTWIRFTKKLQLIKGLGWYMASVLSYIPYTLLAKYLNTSAGVIPGWVSIRVGLCVGSFVLIIGHWKELKPFWGKLGIIAGVKEVFGMMDNFLVLFAMTIGPAALIQSMWSVQAVGILVFGTILAKFGIIKESLKKQDLIQKGFGVALVAIATALLFL